jgi:hypothetical protein
VSEYWDDDLNGADVLIDRNSPDLFGVPLNIMGRHPEDFFSILGRIVALAAVLENKILVFYQYLVGRRQDEYTELSVGQLITNALRELHRLPPADGDRAKQWLLEAEAIVAKRNAYVHNMWPAQGDGRLFGWRVPKKRNATEAITSEGTLEEMRVDLNRLVALLQVNRLHRILGLVSGGDHLKG